MSRAEFVHARAHGLKARQAKRLERWISADEFLRQYDALRDPHGEYGSVGRDPAKILTRKDAS